MLFLHAENKHIHTLFAGLIDFGKVAPENLCQRYGTGEPVSSDSFRTFGLSGIFGAFSVAVLQDRVLHLSDQPPDSEYGGR